MGLELIMEAIVKAGYDGKCKVGMDVAASEFKVEGEDVYDLGTWYATAPMPTHASARVLRWHAVACRIWLVG